MHNEGWRRERLFHRLIEDCNELERVRDSLQSQINNLFQDTIDLKPERRRLAGEVNTLHRRSATLTADITTKENNLAILHEDNTLLEAENQALRDKNNRWKMENKSLKDKNDLLEESLDLSGMLTDLQDLEAVQPQKHKIMQEIVAGRMTVDSWRRLIGTRLMLNVDGYKHTGN